MSGDVPWEDEEDRIIHIMMDPGVRYTKYALWFCGVMYGLLGVTTGPAMGLLSTSDPSIDPAMGQMMGLVVTVVTLAVCIGFGLVNFMAAWGLSVGGKWAWILTLVLGATYLPSGCMPVGAVVMWGMLNEQTRKLFMS